MNLRRFLPQDGRLRISLQDRTGISAQTSEQVWISRRGHVPAGLMPAPFFTELRAYFLYPVSKFLGTDFGYRTGAQTAGSLINKGAGTERAGVSDCTHFFARKLKMGTVERAFCCGCTKERAPRAASWSMLHKVIFRPQKDQWSE